MARKAIFLDRDGVINYPIIKNGKPFPPRKLSELKIYTEVPSFLNLMKSKGFYLIVITNQPDVARGDISKFRVEEINKLIYDLNEVELQIKKNLEGSINLVSNFILEKAISKTNSKSL